MCLHSLEMYDTHQLSTIHPSSNSRLLSLSFLLFTDYKLKPTLLKQLASKPDMEGYLNKGMLKIITSSVH